MNQDILEGNWKQLRGAIQKQWGRLTNDELDQISGSSEQLLGIVQKKYGIARDEVEKKLKEIVDASPASTKPHPASSAPS